MYLCIVWFTIFSWVLCFGRLRTPPSAILLLCSLEYWNWLVSIRSTSDCEKNQSKPKMSYGRLPPRIDGMVSLKVDNLTYRTTPEDLRRVFERCGEVGDIYIPRDRFTRESRGFAFVRYVLNISFVPFFLFYVFTV